MMIIMPGEQMFLIMTENSRYCDFYFQNNACIQFM